MRVFYDLVEVVGVKFMELFMVGALDVLFCPEIFGGAFVNAQAVFKLGVDGLITILIVLGRQILRGGCWRLQPSCQVRK